MKLRAESAKNWSCPLYLSLLSTVPHAHNRHDGALNEHTYMHTSSVDIIYSACHTPGSLPICLRRLDLGLEHVLVHIDLFGALRHGLQHTMRAPRRGVETK